MRLVPALPHAPLRVLALGPHVDDVEVGCGATLLLLKRYADAEVHVRVFSDHFAVPVRVERAAEGVAAAAQMGYDSYGSFEFEDTNFPSRWREIQARIAHLRHTVAPELVF